MQSCNVLRLAIDQSLFDADHLMIFTRLRKKNEKTTDVASRRKIEEANLRPTHRGSLVSTCAEGSS